MLFANKLSGLLRVLCLPRSSASSRKFIEARMCGARFTPLKTWHENSEKFVSNSSFTVEVSTTGGKATKKGVFEKTAEQTSGRLVKRQRGACERMGLVINGTRYSQYKCSEFFCKKVYLRFRINGVPCSLVLSERRVANHVLVFSICALSKRRVVFGRSKLRRYGVFMSLFCTFSWFSPCQSLSFGSRSQKAFSKATLTSIGDKPLRSIALNYVKQKGPTPPKSMLKAIGQLKKNEDIIITRLD